MNKEYLYLDGKCIVYDENGAIKDQNGKIDLKEYSSNFDEILVQENIIESLENDLDETDKDIKKRKEAVKSNKSTTWFSAISFGTLPFIVQQLLKFLIGKEELLMLMSTNDAASIVIKGVTIVLTAVFGGVFTFSSYTSYKYNKKRLNGQLRKKEEIEKTIEKEKEKLEDLNKTREYAKLEENICSKKVSHLYRLTRLRDYLDIYYSCAFNREIFQKYLQANKLEKKLRKYYNDEEIELIRQELMKEEGYQRKLK